MITVTILPISDANGEKFYRAIAGDKHSVGTTAGQALDALTVQLGEVAPAISVKELISAERCLISIPKFDSFSPEKISGVRIFRLMLNLEGLWE